MSGILDLIFAPICLGCDGSLPRGAAARLVCGRCVSRLRPLPSPACPRCGAPVLRTGRDGEARCAECEPWPPYLRLARSAVLLHPPADRIVHQLKYRGWRALAEPMAERMSRLPLPEDVASEARDVVPVPTTTARLRSRGYNQAELIAAAFARRTDRRVRSLLLRRGVSGSQTSLQPVARATNVAGAFTVAGDAHLERAHLILVDDVLTTGATARECARALLDAGARCVSLITFARALDARRLITT